MADLPDIVNRYFEGNITVVGTSTLTGNVTAAGTLGVTGNVTASGDLTVTGDLIAPQLVTEEITDPGDAGAIPVTSSGSVMLTTAGAETRTLAIPTFVGQYLNIGLDTDGGDCVITVAQPVNQTGNNTLTGADAGDQISLIAITVGGAFRWRVVCNDGWGLTTV